MFRARFTVIALAIASACSGEAAQVELGGGCTLNTDCQAPYVCAFSRCHAACAADRDCPVGERCVTSDPPQHVCQLPNERDCTHSSDCPNGEICAVDLQCRVACLSDRDC